MEFVNYATKAQAKADISQDQWRTTIATFVELLAPFAPYLAEELWEVLGNSASVHLQSWPEYDPELIKDNAATIIVQINGKLRSKFVISTEDAFSKDGLERLARNLMADSLKTIEVIKVIVVPGKLVNFVTR
jgi:leucyl-tRNA synthetase